MFFHLIRKNIIPVSYTHLSHENGTTVFSVPEKVDEAKVEEVIKEAGYEFKGITQE